MWPAVGRASVLRVLGARAASRPCALRSSTVQVPRLPAHVGDVGSCFRGRSRVVRTSDRGLARSLPAPLRARNAGTQAIARVPGSHARRSNASSTIFSRCFGSAARTGRARPSPVAGSSPRMRKISRVGMSTRPPARVHRISFALRIRSSRCTEMPRTSAADSRPSAPRSRQWGGGRLRYFAGIAKV